MTEQSLKNSFDILQTPHRLAAKIPAQLRMSKVKITGHLAENAVTALIRYGAGELELPLHFVPELVKDLTPLYTETGGPSSSFHGFATLVRSGSGKFRSKLAKHRADLKRLGEIREKSVSSKEVENLDAQIRHLRAKGAIYSTTSSLKNKLYIS
jgi:hypothetical protein